MQIKKLSHNALECRTVYDGVGSIEKVLLLSDTHQDSKKAHLNLLKEHLNEALKDNVPVFIFGDVLDLMGHHKDPRTTNSDLKESLRVTNYFQQVIDEATEFFKPYASVIVALCDGNHETNVLRRHSINILANLCNRLEVIKGEKIYYLPSDGWLRFNFERCTGGSVYTSTLFYNHFGTGGRRSKGVLSADLRQADIEADIYVTGHNHMKWTLPQSRLYLTRYGYEQERKKLHINLGCYKQNETGGYGRTKGFYTTNLGGYYLEFILKKYNKRYSLNYRAIEAI